jgi:hypothetical protein
MNGDEKKEAKKIWDPFSPKGELEQEIGEDGFANRLVMYSSGDPKRRLFKKWDPKELESIKTLEDLWAVTKERVVNDRRSVREFYHNRQERVFDYWICEEIADFLSEKLGDPPKIDVNLPQNIALIVSNYEEFYTRVKRRIWRSQKQDYRGYLREGQTVSTTDESEEIEEKERKDDEEAHIDSYLPEKLETRIDRQMKVMGDEITKDIDAKIDLKEDKSKVEIREEETAEEYAKSQKPQRGRPRYRRVPINDKLISYFEVECLSFIKENGELIDKIHGHHTADVQRLFIENLGQGKLSARTVAEELGISQRIADRKLAFVRDKFKRMAEQLEGQGSEAVMKAVAVFML